MKRKITALLVGMAISTVTCAQDFKGPIKIVVPFGAGGATDVVARLLAPGLSKHLGQSVIVENKPGASGQLGTAAVKVAPADGSTFLLALDHSVVVVPMLTPTANYDAVKDFVAVGQVARFQWTFSVPFTSPAKNLGEFVEVVRKDPTQGNYGVPLQGGVPDIIGSVLSAKGNVKMEAVPFGGSAALMPQLLGGHLAAGVTGEPEGLQMFKGGKVRILAISGGKRSTFLPNVPTFEEQGYTGLNVNSFNAFFAPKGLPRALAEKFNAAVRETLNDKEVQQKIHEMSLEITPANLDESAKELNKSYEFWRRAGVTPKA